MSIIHIAANPTDLEQAYSSQSFAAATAIAQQRKQKTMLFATNQQKLMRRRASATHSRPKQGLATGPQCVGHGGGSSSSVSAGAGCCCAIDPQRIWHSAPRFGASCLESGSQSQPCNRTDSSATTARRPALEAERMESGIGLLPDITEHGWISDDASPTGTGTGWRLTSTSTDGTYSSTYMRTTVLPGTHSYSSSTRIRIGAYW